jgi:hypothetical protein
MTNKAVRTPAERIELIIFLVLETQATRMPLKLRASNPENHQEDKAVVKFFSIEQIRQAARVAKTIYSLRFRISHY